MTAPNRGVLNLLAVVAAFALMGCSGNAPSFADGVRAYNQNRIAEAETVFARVASNGSASVHDRAAAYRAVARIAWLIDGDERRAIEAVDRASAIGEKCQAARLRARILDEAGKANEFIAGVDELLPQCADAQGRDEIRYYAADSLLAVADRSRSAEALGRAHQLLSAISRVDATDLHVATLRLELALIEGKADAAVNAWRDYFWLTDPNGPQALAAVGPLPAERFARGLARDASTNDRLVLLDLLARAGFSRQADRLARRWDIATAAAGDPLWRKISAYLEQRRKIEAIVLASNRRVARGGRPADLGAAYRSMDTALAAAAGVTGDVREGIAKSYGLYGRAERTGNFESLHLGHIVQSERRAIDQYGRHAEVRYLVIDNMVSNGYESWLWDGDATDGGWTEDGPVIVQARPGYTVAPVEAWRLVADNAHRRDYLDRLPALEADDRAALQSADVAYLPGLAHRLNLQLAEQIMSRARVLAGKNGDLHRAFLAEYSRASLQQSIFIHEGRHALDLHIIRGSSLPAQVEREYRAKLSELALSDYPRLALFNIDGATIDGDNEHGRANRRIMSQYASWVLSHAGEVKGYDPASKPVAQLDKLSDVQIRTIARALDPFARPQPGH